ncbi:TetR/AcrR family transcriptional regulator [Chitinophaga cymbidii]|uniref:TetR family transcriptional regulator n=1 Tax=Chitinophaga cymbidii TaxID=1096750 RepID=A0A512RTD8_9BACT|nr:TetR/AcrR family transcriptional regulator [Chitinophaga cymbidii]GEP98955.1 TetR family transcriptional regulator [Chitinophaga cymbidii]
MGISDRKEREKQEMKRLIIDAATHMFLEEGYEKTSIRNIADKIEYSPGTIYLYYKDKDELLHEVQREAFRRLLEAFEEKAPSRNPWKRLEQITQTYIQFGHEQPELYDLMFIIRAPMNKVEDQGWLNGKGCFSYLMDCVQECVSKKLIRFSDPRAAALSVWSMCHGFVSLNIRCRMKILEMDEAGVEKLIAATVQEYLRMIKA